MVRRLSIALLFWTASAGAIPAPMSAEELDKKAELVVQAEVERVECAGAPADKGDFIATEYRSELRIVRALKGKAEGKITLSGYQIEWKKEQPTGMPPTAPLAKGWRGKLHLDRAPGGDWVPVWYNAVEEDPASSKPEPLPECGPRRSCTGCALPPHSATGAWLAAAALALLALRRGGRSNY